MKALPRKVEHPPKDLKCIYDFTGWAETSTFVPHYFRSSSSTDSTAHKTDTKMYGPEKYFDQLRYDNCPGSYFGETSRPVSVRILEQQKNLRYFHLWSFGWIGAQYEQQMNKSSEP